VKLYQAVDITEKVQTLRERATILRGTDIASLVVHQSVYVMLVNQQTKSRTSYNVPRILQQTIFA